MTDSTEMPAAAVSRSIAMSSFLEDTPPSVQMVVNDLRVRSGRGQLLNTPDLQLHCGAPPCGGVRTFTRIGDVIFFAEESQEYFVHYWCRNCHKTFKTYAITVRAKPGESEGVVLKYGEAPAFGPPTPARLISLIGPDRDEFLKGRRSEIQGLGIGAFGYYRRVVERQKDRILDQVIQVAQNTGADSAVITTLEGAKVETQFAKAMEMVRDAIPESLKINGHNPLTLLHSALSEGLHQRSDEECLELASAIRVVLQELAERAAVALKDEAELRNAVSRLFKKP